MIKLDRSRVKAPASWAEKVRKAFPDCDAFWKSVAEFEALDIDDPARRAGFRSYAAHVLPRKGKTGSCDFKTIWGIAKQVLAEMAHHKCAYCESPIDAKRSAAVEHFKPKALFPSLVYEWANYFLGCGGCNGAKGDKWPDGGKEYVRPDEGDPSTWFVFHEDGRIEAGEKGSGAELTLQALNMHRSWLCRQRALEISRALEELEDLLMETGIPLEIRKRLARRLLERSRSPEQRYSAAVMQCLRRAWERECPGVPFEGPF
jgi:uncharacterized protein (TIGR02646 family)